MERPSKYHRLGHSGKGRVWYWDSSHEDLEPTSTFAIKYKHFCSYCCNEAYSIQEGLRDGGNYYKITGYTCICESAEKEKELKRQLEELENELKRQLEELENEYKERIYQLKKSYEKILKHNKKKRLEMIHVSELKEIERFEDSFEFRSDN